MPIASITTAKTGKNPKQMLLKILCSLTLRRPSLGIGLFWGALRDRLGFHRDGDEVHLLDVVRHVARSGGSVMFDSADHLLLSFPVGHSPARCRLRLGDSDVRVFREVIVHEAYRDSVGGLERVGKAPWVIDAGANIGMASLYIRGRYPSARIVALEPDDANVAQIRWHLENNGATNVAVVQAALWPVRTRLRFAGAGTSGPSWGLRVEAGDDGPIDAVSPLDLMRDHGIDRVALLKLDVEGSEFPLLAHPDAAVWLARVDAIIAEVHPDLGDPGVVVGALRAAGFVVRDLGGNILIAERPPK